MKVPIERGHRPHGDAIWRGHPIERGEGTPTQKMPTKPPIYGERESRCKKSNVLCSSAARIMVRMYADAPLAQHSGCQGRHAGWPWRARAPGLASHSPAVAHVPQFGLASLGLAGVGGEASLRAGLAFLFFGHTFGQRSAINSGSAQGDARIREMHHLTSK